MKHLVKPIKYMFGIMYILFKIVSFVLCCIMFTIWNFSFSFYTELYEEFFDSFFVSYVFTMERWRYSTLSDFLNDNKCYTYSEFYKEKKNKNNVV